jgi:BspA type Leucine rich repeat region (6 copies)
MRTKKTLFPIVLFSAALLLPIAVRAQSYYTNGVDIYSYTATAGNITITGYLGSGSAVTVPDTIGFTPVTGIASLAFAGNSVTGVMLGTNMANIAPAAFCNCPNLLAIIVNPANPVYSDVEGILFDKDQATLEDFPPGVGGTYPIPDGVTTIEDAAFFECTNLTGVTIPNSVTNIESSAFDDCSSLTGVTIPNSVTTVGTYMFNFCTKLTNVVIPNSVTSIQASAFDSCISLTNITIPNNVTSIDEEAFIGCSSLKNVVIPNNVTNLGQESFYGCTSLTNVTIGAGVTTIGDAAFVQCTNLARVIIPNSVTDIEPSAFQECSGLSSIIIPNSLTIINSAVFADCGALTNVTIPDSVTNIESSAFQGCTSLASVTIPNSVTSLGEQSFFYCPSLTNVTVGTGVTSIGDEAFEQCLSLTGIYFQGNAPSLGGTSVFADVGATAEVYYQPNATGWGTTFGGLTTSLYFPGNLVANWGFETGSFADWSQSDCVISSSDHTGKHAVQVNGNASTSGSLTQILPTQTGRVYVLSFWMESSESAVCRILWSGSAPQVIIPGSSWTHSQFTFTATNTSTVLEFLYVYLSEPNSFVIDDISVVPLTGYGQLKAQPVNGGVQLSFFGLASTNYALDRTFDLAPPITWVPQATNATGTNGMLVLTNTPVATTNNFWRIRSVP